MIERFFSLQTKRVVPENLLDEVLSMSGRTVPRPEAIEKLKTHSALGEIIAAGMTAMQLNPLCAEEEFSAQVQAAGRRVAAKLERNLSALGSIASIAPLLGLFGTVVGMIEIFGAQIPGAGNPAELAHGISVALYNTAFGLVIAIPSLVVWRHLRAKVDNHVVELEIDGERLVRHFFPKSAGQ